MNYSDTKSEISQILQCEYFAVVGDFPACNLCSRHKLCEKVRMRVIFHEGKIKVKQNTSVRFERNGEIEVVKYDKPYELVVRSDELHNISENVDRSRITAFNPDIKAHEVVKDVFVIQNLRRSISNSSKRSLQKFYDLVLANDWHYFLTLTFSSQFIDRFDDEAVGEAWSVFQKFLKKNNPNCKILICPERHKNGALHFHGLLSDCPNIRLSPAINSKTGKPIKNKFTGLPTLNVLDWKYGFSTVDVFPADFNCLRVVNYISKYITKERDVDKFKKKYYHTRNLDCCNSENYFYTDSEFNKLINSYDLKPIKNSVGMTVYRGHLRE